MRKRPSSCGSALGRPRWLMTIADAPASSTCLIVGTAARIRRSFVMLPASSSGTLKSTRMRTRLPRISRSSSMVFLTIESSSMDERHSRVTSRSPLQHLADAGHQVRRPAAVAPFVVVPAQHLDELTLAARHDHCALGVEDATVGVADDVAGDERIFRILENALKGA